MLILRTFRSLARVNFDYSELINCPQTIYNRIKNLREIVIAHPGHLNLTHPNQPFQNLTSLWHSLTAQPGLLQNYSDVERFDILETLCFSVKRFEQECMGGSLPIHPEEFKEFVDKHLSAEYKKLQELSPNQHSFHFDTHQRISPAV